MAKTHEKIFYELMRKAYTVGNYPVPWWVRQYCKDGTDEYNKDVFGKDGIPFGEEAAFSSNAHYRYWDMAGVKGQSIECLIGPSGELEPAPGRHSLGFFLIDESNRITFPQDPGANLTHGRDERLPFFKTTLAEAGEGSAIRQDAFAGVINNPTANNKVVVVSRFKVKRKKPMARFGIIVAPFGPSGFHYRSIQKVSRPPTSRVEQIHFGRETNTLSVHGRPAVLFRTPPMAFGLYGKDDWYSEDIEHDPVSAAVSILRHSPFHILAQGGRLNGKSDARDHTAGLCMAVFLWELSETPLEALMLIDDFYGDDDVLVASNSKTSVIEEATRRFWTGKLEQGFRVDGRLFLEGRSAWNLYETCRVNLLTLTDQGKIHPGPTIYDYFWVRDSTVSSFAAALAGDLNVAGRQVLDGFTANQKKNEGTDTGFFGDDKEKTHEEWDCNGQALWIMGMLDRIAPGKHDLASVRDGARWIHRKCGGGLLPKGWSAEHLGDNDGRPYYWDDYWALAGLREAARLAERAGEPSAAKEIWDYHYRLKNTLAHSIRDTLDALRASGEWRTFIPASPCDVPAGPWDSKLGCADVPSRSRREYGETLKSTAIGTLAYFHPCRLYKEAGLDSVSPGIDNAAELTLESLWHSPFVEERDGRAGFRHDSRDWKSYAPYLTMQFAHAYLFLSAINDDPDKGKEQYERFIMLFRWVVREAFPPTWENGNTHPIVSGAWNEQHCYPVAVGEKRHEYWYMGDIPHGWACAEYMLLVRYMLCFEHDIDRDPSRIHVGAGLGNDTLPGGALKADHVPTLFGRSIGIHYDHNVETRKIMVTLERVPEHVSLRIHCRYGSIVKAIVDGQGMEPTAQNHLDIPGSVHGLEIEYRS
uniref:Uncharacterized protein n=1 Tax=Candidatus Kentrum sp. FM TaxID=2126340 RepID=A0A450SZL8_9GAMM|nr:MAG: hypothetical protein BECKFM1743C_GA0114222_102114 [Candidatus Kentron sp. FM]VFJ59689.1 MAG: hypothetical protein BECKFM1743A_GA0114220_102434 [Candidatus Kentron sp. FM]VFK10556.1 MAG: hypothetical protein BECKFM1743B_GA0114221_101445 [Candidatus Kentron sp. FM]